MKQETIKLQRVQKLTITAVFMGLLLLQSFVPNLGYVRILPTLPAVTTITLTVAIYAALLGPKAGALFGLFWGLISLFMAYTQPGDMVSLLLFQNPIICLVPRVLAGFFPGWFAQKLANRRSTKVLQLTLTGVIASLTNTFFVIALTTLFFLNHATTLTSHLGSLNTNSPLFVILAVALGANGIAEAIFTGVLTPIIVLPLKHALMRRVVR